MQLKLFYKHFLVSIPLPGPVHTCPLLFWAFRAVALFGRRGLSASGVHLQQEYNLRVSAFFFLALGFAFLCICYHIFVLSLSRFAAVHYTQMYYIWHLIHVLDTISFFSLLPLKPLCPVPCLHFLTQLWGQWQPVPRPCSSHPHLHPLPRIIACCLHKTRVAPQKKNQTALETWPRNGCHS